MPGLKAAIIAGGKGTRIRSLAGDSIPKALLPVLGEPIVFRQMRLLVRYGVSDAAVMAGYLADKLKKEMLPRAEQLGLRLHFFVEEKSFGTAGGFTAAKDFFEGENFFVVYGDVAVEMDLGRLLEFHLGKGAIATIVSHPNDHPHESDLLRTDENGRVLQVLPRRDRRPGFYRNLVPAAVYCFSSKVFEYIEPLEKQDFILDVFPRMIKSGCPVYSYNTPEYLRDMGTVVRYKMVENDIRSGFFEKANFSVKRPTVFFDRDGVLNKEIGGNGLVHHDQLELAEGAAKGVRLVNEAGLLAVVVTNQPQVAKGFTTFDELNIIHAKLETLLGRERTKIDRIYFCPHHPEGGFAGEIPELKVECDCRKPKAGMLFTAAEELPIKVDESCVIGDTWRDVGAARAAGVYAYGVRTGFGCRDCKVKYRPDLIFSDVLEAVKFILFGINEVKTLAEKIAMDLSRINRVFVLGICGLARSGKSTFAHSLLKELKKHGKAVLHVRLDDWILPISRRRAESVSEERSQTNLYAELLKELLGGGEISAPGYDPATRDFAEGLLYKLTSEQVVILDGLYGCHESIKDKLDYGVYVDAEKSLLKSRFYEFYKWKGMINSQIEELFEQRKAEEWPAVKKQCQIVDEKIIITHKEV